MWIWLFACTSTPEAPPPKQGVDPALEAQHPSANDLKPDVGRWNKARTASQDELEALKAIGYVGGTEEGRGLVGVTMHQPAAQPGLNFYVSGDSPEAFLMDMDGEQVHHWKLPFRTAFPKKKVPKNVRGTDFWRRAALLPDGSVVAIYEGQGIVRVDRDSKLVWAWDGDAHHDLQILGDDLWILSRTAHVNPTMHPKRPILEDFVTVLSLADGTEKRSFSVLEAIRGSDAKGLLSRLPKKFGDIFHTNSIEVLDGSAAQANPAFAKGNLLLSSRALSAIFVVDPTTEKVVWHHTGAYAKQHDPKIIGPDRLLLFDNLGPDGRNGHRSAVREYQISTMQQVWDLTGSDDEPLFSRFCGAAERLPNGNTLIVESGYGRAFEVAPDGTKVWEFYNPRRTGDDDEFVAIVPDLIRVDPATLEFVQQPTP